MPSEKLVKHRSKISALQNYFIQNWKWFFLQFQYIQLPKFQCISNLYIHSLLFALQLFVSLSQLISEAGQHIHWNVHLPLQFGRPLLRLVLLSVHALALSPGPPHLRAPPLHLILQCFQFERHTLLHLQRQLLKPGLQRQPAQPRHSQLGHGVSGVCLRFCGSGAHGDRQHWRHRRWRVPLDEDLLKRTGQTQGIQELHPQGAVDFVLSLGVKWHRSTLRAPARGQTELLAGVKAGQVLSKPTRLSAGRAVHRQLGAGRHTVTTCSYAQKTTPESHGEIIRSSGAVQERFRNFRSVSRLFQELYERLKNVSGTLGAFQECFRNFRSISRLFQEL